MSQWWMGLTWGLLLGLVVQFIGKFTKEWWDSCQPPKFKTWVVWGTPLTIRDRGEDSIAEYGFRTKAELDAFRLGLAEHDGWESCNPADSREDAEEFVAQFHPRSPRP